MMSNIQTLYSIVDCMGWLVIGIFLGFGMAALIFLLITRNEVDDDIQD